MNDYRPREHPGPGLALITMALGLAAGTAWAWTGTTPDGAEVQVDPQTHRATRTQDGQAVPLWNGVHRLDDGSVVIVRDGNAVPTEPMLRAWEGGAAPEEDLVGQPCQLLERRTCGQESQCAPSPACFNARRLLNAEREEQRRAPIEAGPRPPTATTAQCTVALLNPGLADCGAGQLPAAPNPCQVLVERVCGADQRCAAAPACPPARQLLGQDGEERATTGAGGTPSGGQCREALGNPFFVPCP